MVIKDESTARSTEGQFCRSGIHIHIPRVGALRHHITIIDRIRSHCWIPNLHNIYIYILKGPICTILRQQSGFNSKTKKKKKKKERKDNNQTRVAQKPS